MNEDFRFDTAPMIGLTTGPDTFGIVAGLSAQDAMFDALRNQAPDDALVALLRVDNLPGHPDLICSALIKSCCLILLTIC